MDDGFLVGRHRPALLLEGAVDRAHQGYGGLVLVTGEPGIGKTVLLKDVAVRAQARGARVLFGTCWEGAGAPGHWPWIQVLRAAEASVAPDVWARSSEGRDEALAPLLGTVGEASTPRGDGRDRAFELQEAVTGVLVGCAAERPVVVVLDDLHWADPASVRLLDFAVRHAGLAPVLFVAAYRDADLAEPGDPVGALLADLAPKAQIVPLGGLDEDAVEALLLRHGHRGLPRAVVADVCRRTGGNPFFVEQTALLWSAGGGVSATPPGVAAAVERRLARLDAFTADLLTTAALLGNDVDPALLAAAGGVDDARVEAALATATRARLLRGHGASRRFVHDLVRESLRDGLPPADASRRHAAIVELAGLTPGRRAHHAVHAVGALDPADVAGILADAATDAERRSAWEEAAGHLARAVEVAPDEDRVALLLRLGDAQRGAGLLDAARDTYRRLATIATARDDAELQARAALGAHDLGHAIDDDSKAPEAAIDAAYEALVATTGGEPRGALAARLLAAVARTRSHLLSGDRQEAAEASARAVEVARASGDDGALAFSLLARHDAIWSPGTASERAALAAEMEGAARRAGDDELALQAVMLRAFALIEQGDPEGLVEHDRFVASADRSPFPRQRYIATSRRAAIAMLRGELAAAEAYADDALAFGRRLGELDAVGVWGDQTFELARLRGDPARIEALIDELRPTGDPHLVVYEAAVAVDRGSVGLALRRFEELRDLGERWPQWAALVWITFVAETAALAKDPRLLAEARAAVDAHVDDWAVLAGGVFVHGPLRYAKACLDAAAGEHDAAIAAFDLAHEAAARFGAVPWSLRARLGRAGSRLARGRADDRARARAELVAVAREADELGMALVAADAARRLAEVSVPDPATAPGATPANELRRAGDTWCLTFGDRTIHLPDAKGLNDLHVLLGHPGAEIPAVALVDPPGGQLVVAARSIGADAVLDERAKAAYRRRLADLDAAIDDATARGDDGGAAAAERERDALIDELRRATGLGGRDRRLGDESERARKTVTARIRDTLRKLETAHPELAAHLRDHVTTGTTCSYRPPAGGAPWRL